MRMLVVCAHMRVCEHVCVSLHGYMCDEHRCAWVYRCGRAYRYEYMCVYVYMNRAHV